MYKNRTMNAEKMVYLLMILPRYRLYLTVSVPIPNQRYSGWTVLSVFTPRSTRSLFFCLISGQAVYLVQSNSKFTDQVTETMFGVIPGAVKIDWAIHSLLDHCLSPTGFSLATIFMKGAWTVWVDCVNIVDPSTRFVQLNAVLSYWR